MVRGSYPDWKRRRRALALREQGLTLAQVGRRLGITRQGAHSLLQAARGKTYRRQFRVRCRSCGGDINPAGALPQDDRRVFCLGCLEARPGATFGQRLKAIRLAAGLTKAELARQAGIWDSVIVPYEEGRIRPRPDTLARLVRVLGAGLVGDKRGE